MNGTGGAGQFPRMVLLGVSASWLLLLGVAFCGPSAGSWVRDVAGAGGERTEHTAGDTRGHNGTHRDPAASDTRGHNGKHRDPTASDTRGHNGKHRDPAAGDTRGHNGTHRDPAAGDTRGHNGTHRDPAAGDTRGHNGTHRDPAAGDTRGHNGTHRDPAAVPRSRTFSQAALVDFSRESMSETNNVELSSGPVSRRRFLRSRRSSLTDAPLGPSLPQTGPASSAFGVRFHKCAQVKPDSDPPEVSFFLLIHNTASAAARGSNLSQLAVRDSISGVVPVRSQGREVEAGFQSFAVDALLAGSQVVLNYSAHIRSLRSAVLELPAFLTFSSASQNDVNMFGPLTANLTLRVNATTRTSPNHAVHLAGFVGGFLVSVVMVLSGFLVMNWIDPSLVLRFCHRRRNGGALEAEFGDSDDGDGFKDDTAFENKMVDVMVLEEPQNMPQALDSLEMSSLLHASNQLEAARLQIHKALLGALLGRGDGRLLEVVQGQVMGAEGRLKEQLEGRMAALAAQCNRETRDAMEAEHLRQREGQERAEQLCQRAEPQTVLHCSLLLEKLHKLSQSWLQRHLLVRHEEASARVQREITEQRRVELHQIFCEELEEATRLGEMDHSTAAGLQHQYFACQDLLEDVLDEVVAHQRLVLSERQAQRSFLVQSLQSLHSFISETFSSSSRALDAWLSRVRRLGRVPVEQLEPLCDRAQQQVALLRQRLEEALTEEKRALRCELLKKRRELLANMVTTVRLHRQQQKSLSSSDISPDGAGLLQMFHSWRNLLSTHSSEFSELVKRLDEEAATDIRKVTTRLLEGTAAELRVIQPSLAQALQAALPPGERHLLPTDDAAVTVDAAQTDRLHQDGQAALLALNAAREKLQGALQRELREQREARDRSRAFFRRLCSCQLTLSEVDLLLMKLEFHKCFCVMDRCLVLPPAEHRAKLQRALDDWRSEQERLLVQTRSAAKGKSGSTKLRAGSELRHFQRSLQERAALLERLKEAEPNLSEKVSAQLQMDRQTSLLSQACVLSSRLISGHVEKVQSRSRALQMWTALMCLQSVLIQELTQRRDKMADSVHAHWEGLAAAEEQFHKDLSSLPDSSQTEASDSEREVFQLQHDGRMVSILQGALHKREQLLCVLAQSCERWTSRSQETEELREQLELRRLQQLCHQELTFVCDLVKLTEVPPDVLKEMFRLLMPSLPESEFLSVTEPLCPKQSSADPQHCSGSSSRLNNRLVVKLRHDVISKAAANAPVCTEETDSLDEKRRDLLQKLLPSACAPPPAPAPPLKVHPNETESKPDSGNPQSESSDQARPGSPSPEPGPSASGPVRPDPDEYLSLPRGCHGDDPDLRLFVFREPPLCAQTPGGATRKRKRNFLNFKKNAVLPMNAI